VDYDHMVSGLAGDGGQAVFRGEIHLDFDRMGRSGPTWINVAEVVVKRRDDAAVVLTVVREASHLGVDGQPVNLLPPGARVRLELSP
jgi:hypothetical protein